LRIAAIQHILTVASLHRRPPRKIIRDDGYQTNLGVTVLGEILEVASFVVTPLGAILAVSVAAAAFFYGRWVLAD
jgi:uncharacterized protein (DUF697 family)